jgi:dsRNA-specific ribonuclease
MNDNQPLINTKFINSLLISEIKFKSTNYDMSIFKEAFQHASLQKLNPKYKSYERLEYLGDSLFHLILTQYLYDRYDSESEGFLTRLRISLERGDSLVQLTKTLQLTQFIQVYQSNLNDHILEDIFESFIGAFYLNFHFDVSHNFIVTLIEKYKDFSSLIFDDKNYKDLLLRYFHQMKWGHPVYHDGNNNNNNNNNEFIRYVIDPNNNILGKAKANSKSKAEQLASKLALVSLGVIIDEEIDQDWLNKIVKNSEQDLNLNNEEEKIKNDISVYNSKNKLITVKVIKQIFTKYNLILTTSNVKSITSNLNLYQEALTHRTYLARTVLTELDILESKGAVELQPKSNERLRFLGVTVIHFVISENLYESYPLKDEGFLTRLRSKLENKESLYDIAIKTKIYKYVLMSQGMEIMGGRTNTNVICGGFCAFIGAVHLNLGFDIAKKLLINIFHMEIDINSVIDSETNYKERLMQYYNKMKLGIPDYRLIEEEGPDNRKSFTIGIFINNKLQSQFLGKGSSKKRAEQEVAKMMYKYLIENEPNSNPNSNNANLSYGQ